MLRHTDARVTLDLYAQAVTEKQQAAADAMAAPFLDSIPRPHRRARALAHSRCRLTMPPVPLEYHGRDAVACFLVSFGRQGRRYGLVPTRSNGELAFGTYLRVPTGGIRHGTGLDVLTLAGERIRAITHFDGTILPSFGLPRSLPGCFRGRRLPATAGRSASRRSRMRELPSASRVAASPAPGCRAPGR